MHVRAKKSLGQNFLQDPSVIDRIVDALELSPGDDVIEIGPGQGALTAELLRRGAAVAAIEFDKDMVAILQDRFQDDPNLTVLQQDVLDVDLSSVIPSKDTAKVAANLPYNISTAILQRFIETAAMFERLVLMFQKEVVERITALPGDSSRGYLTVIVENAFDVEKLFDVPPGAFRPVPKVMSSVVRLTPRTEATVDGDALSKLASIAFTQKRKTLANNFKKLDPDLSATAGTGIDLRRRAETLSMDEWKSLIEHLKKAGLI